MDRSLNMKRFFLSDTSGATFILVALVLMTLMIGLAVAVDTTRAFLVRSKAQTALDAALIGASSIATTDISDAELDARALNFVLANFPDDYMGVDIGADNLTLNFNRTTGQVSGTLDVGFTPAFASILGQTTFNIGVEGEVTRILGDDLEIALALDHTSSMCAPVSCAGPACFQAPCAGTKAGSRIQVLSEGVQVLFDEIKKSSESTFNQDDSKVLYSYIPFNHEVKINNTVVHNVDGSADYLPNSLGLREDTDPIITAMQDITIENTGNTNAARGVQWAWRSLRQPDRNRFMGSSAHQYADHPKVAGDQDVIKAMIIFSDGLNEFTYYERTTGAPSCNAVQGCPNPFADRDQPVPGPAWRRRSNNNPPYNTNANSDQRAMCNAINAEGIAIYPILLNKSLSTPEGAEAKSICDACAEWPDVNGVPQTNRKCFTPTTAAELVSVFRTIARDLINLRITK